MTKKKQFVILATFVVLAFISCVSALVVVLTASNQASTSKVNVDYTASDVYVKIKANYYIGSNTVAMVNGDSTEVVLSPINHSGSLNQPNAKTTSALMDVDSGGKVVFEYIFENLSGTVPAKISQMTNADGTPYVPTDTYNNVNVQYVGTSKVMGASAYGGKDTISDIAILPLSTKYIYVIVSVKDLMHDVQYKGSFGWMLSRADLVDNTTENATGGTIISGTDDADVVNKDEMNKVNLVLDCENEKPNIYPQKANKCFTGWYTKDESGNEIEVEWPALITSSTKIYPKYEDETPGLSYTYTGDGYAIIGGYNGSTSNIFVPDVHNDGTHGNAKITSIASYAFIKNKNIIEVVFPNSVKTIGGYAFTSCVNLKSIFIPSSVNNISTGAFAYTYALEKIVVDPQNSTYDSRDNCNGIIETANNRIIVGCKTSVIPNTIEIIGGSSFSGCKYLENVNIPSSVTYIETYAFDNCQSLTNITFQSSDKSLTFDSKAFQSCISLSEFYIPANVTLIADQTFKDCQIEKIVVDSKNTIYDSRNSCNAIIKTATNELIVGCYTTVIPSSVQSIGAYSFVGCGKLTKLEIPQGIKEIKEYAFQNCTSITSISIPASVTSIASSALYGCSKLGSISVDTGNTKYDSRDNCNAIIETSSNKLIVACGATIIPNTVKILAKDSFYVCNGMTSLHIPASVTLIETGAIYGCKFLKSLTVDNANTVYNSGNNSNIVIETATKTVVAGCNNSVIPSGITKIGEYAFAGLTMDTISIPTTVTEIGGYAFWYNFNLQSITIPSSVKTIADNAFAYCTKLTNVELSNGLETLGDFAFRDANLLASITIPASVIRIGQYAFVECASLTSVKFDDVEGWAICYRSNEQKIMDMDISTTDFVLNANNLRNVYTMRLWKKNA